MILEFGAAPGAAKVGSAAATRGQLGPPEHTPEPLKPKKQIPRGAAERHAAVLLRPGKASGGSTPARPGLECPRPGYACRETSVFCPPEGGGGGWSALPVGQGRPGGANFRDRLRRHREARCSRAQKGGWGAGGAQILNFPFGSPTTVANRPGNPRRGP